MTENKGPEQPLGQSMQPGPGQEHFDKFRIGEEEAKQFFQPEMRAELPGMGREADGDQEEEDPRAEWERRMGGMFGGPESLFGNLRRKVKELGKPRSRKLDEISERLQRAKPEDKDELSERLEEARSERKAEIRKELGELYEGILHEGFEELGELETMLFRLHNPYPYDSRWGLQFFERLRRNINSSLRDKETGEEGKNWLRSLKEDVLWGESLFHLEEAMGPSFMFYYDGELQMRVLRTVHSKATATDFRRVYAENLKGLGLGQKERDTFGSLEQLGKESLRQLAVRYNRDNLFWRFAAASAQQWDYDKPPPKPGDTVGSNERTQMYLEARELEFIYLVFGEGERINYKGHLIPQKTLNFYNMDSDEQTMETYYARMQALLLVDAKRRLDGGEEISALAAEVKGVASGIEEELDALDEAELKQRLAQTVTKSGIILDWGTMACGELGWGWKYKKNEKGEYERTSDTGGVYNAFDVPTVMYWMRHNIDYDANSERRSSLIPPSVGHAKIPEQGVSPRSEWPKHPPDWRPSVEAAMMIDPLLRQEIERLRTNYYADAKLRPLTSPEVTFGKLDPKVLAYIEKNIWAFTVPFYNDFTKKDYFISLPMFFPPDVREINFWRVVSLTDKGRTGPSAMDQFFAREDIAKLAWERMPMHRWDYINVNKDMMKQFLGLMVGPHEYDRDKQAEFDKFFEKPSGKSLKELAKRIRLSYRGGSVDMGVQEPAMIADLVVAGTSVRHGLLGPDFWNDEKEQIAWRDDIAEWMNEALNLPGSKADVENYGHSIALLIYVKAKLYWRLGLAASHQQVAEHAGVRTFVDGQFLAAKKR